MRLSRGNRKAGMPKCIKPPGNGPASCISTLCPRRARWYAADKPLGPAPITRTRFPVGATSTFNGHFSLAARSPRKRSTAWMLTVASSSLRLQLPSQG